jgi:hypothetical protein
MLLKGVRTLTQKEFFRINCSAAYFNLQLTLIIIRLHKRENGTPTSAIDSRIKYNGEETKYKSFAAKDTVKERYPKCHFLAI